VTPRWTEHWYWALALAAFLAFVWMTCACSAAGWSRVARSTTVGAGAWEAESFRIPGRIEPDDGQAGAGSERDPDALAAWLTVQPFAFLEPEPVKIEIVRPLGRVDVPELPVYPGDQPPPPSGGYWTVETISAVATAVVVAALSWWQRHRLAATVGKVWRGKGPKEQT